MQSLKVFFNHLFKRRVNESRIILYISTKVTCVPKNANHIISTCVTIGRGVNIGCDRCFYIAFNNTLKVVLIRSFIKEVLLKNERM